MDSEAIGAALADRVLIVEDDADLRESWVSLLQVRGYASIAAANGAEALARLRQSTSPCSIVLDLMMPVMDGWTLRRSLLADPCSLVFRWWSSPAHTTWPRRRSVSAQWATS
jgi:CheY-like chemotaxis protein